MNSKPNLLSEAHIRESIAGEEDPGAALDVVRAMLKKGQQDAAHVMGESVHIHVDYTCGTDMIGVDVGWPRQGAGHGARDKSTAELLGLLVAHHGEIANTAWSLFSRTGQRSIALEVDEDDDGVFYVSGTD